MIVRVLIGKIFKLDQPAILDTAQRLCGTVQQLLFGNRKAKLEQLSSKRVKLVEDIGKLTATIALIYSTPHSAPPH